jgi:hypothetical protein
MQLETEVSHSKSADLLVHYKFFLNAAADNSDEDSDKHQLCS